MDFISDKRVWVDSDTNSLLDRIFSSSKMTNNIYDRNVLIDIVISEWLNKINSRYNDINDLIRIRSILVNREICLYFNIREELWNSFKDSCFKISINLSIGFKCALLYFVSSEHDIDNNSRIISQENYDIGEFIDILKSGSVVRVCGAYTIYNTKNKYHGSSRDVYNEIRQYIYGHDLDKRLEGSITGINIYFTDNHVSALILERYLILNTYCVNLIEPRNRTTYLY